MAQKLITELESVGTNLDLTDELIVYHNVGTGQSGTEKTGKVTVEELKTVLDIPQSLNNVLDGSSTGSVRTSGSAVENSNYTIGASAFAQGLTTKASGQASHAEGYTTTASGKNAHVEGYVSTASGNYSHAEGNTTQAIGSSSHAEGSSTQATGSSSHAEGNVTQATGWGSHAEGGVSIASAQNSHAEGSSTSASGQASHSEGSNTNAFASYSHAEGYQTAAGSSGSTIGRAAHAEGGSTTASSDYSHAEGYGTTVSGYASHGEGYNTSVTGINGAHGEGYSVTASGATSHAEGYYTSAVGNYSHAEGYYTKASGLYQHVEGKYNIEDSNNTYAHIVGNGTSDNDRANIYTLDWSGNEVLAGSVTAANAIAVTQLPTVNQINSLQQTLIGSISLTDPTRGGDVISQDINTFNRGGFLYILFFLTKDWDNYSESLPTNKMVDSVQIPLLALDSSTIFEGITNDIDYLIYENETLNTLNVQVAGIPDGATGLRMDLYYKPSIFVFGG